MSLSIETKDNIAQAAIQAPSAHNTQPWMLAWSEDTLKIYIDWNRHLTVSDPAARQLMIGIGCAATNAEIAAAHFGYETDIHILENPRQQKNEPAAVLDIKSGQPNKQLASLFTAIESRRTDRRLYHTKPLSNTETKAIPSAESANTVIVDDRKKIDKIATLTGDGSYKSVSKPEFKQELSQWIRSSWTKRRDGMPGYALQMPAALSLLAPLLVKILPAHKKLQRDTHAQIQHAAALVVFATQDDTPQSWLQAGQLLERIWLQATAAGISAAPLAAAVESGPEIRRQLQETIQTNCYPQIVLRLGHAVSDEPLKATPRRSLQDCLKSYEN